MKFKKKYKELKSQNKEPNYMEQIGKDCCFSVSQENLHAMEYEIGRLELVEEQLKLQAKKEKA